MDPDTDMTRVAGVLLFGVGTDLKMVRLVSGGGVVPFGGMDNDPALDQLTTVIKVLS